MAQAEPGALVCEPLEAAVRGRSRGPDVLGHLRVATSAPHVQLIQALVLFLLRADVLSNQRLVPPHRGHEVSARPETLPHKILLPSSVHSRQVNRTLPFDKPDHLRHGVLGRDRNHHVHVIRQQMPFLNPAFLLLRQFAEHFSHILPQVPIQRLPATLGINTTWYLHSHFEWLKLSYSSIQFLLCVCFAAHARSFLDGLPYLSNFACLPGRAGGTPISLVCSRAAALADG